ncbi:MAG: hypothetical protein PHV98_07435 [Candidatus Omnitrophica bacterium]|nr:hypothetical protein [Candidatus Omnitrophota bacterium]
MITRWAVKWLTWQLRKDKGFYIAYQANIAMAFKDEYSRSVKPEDTQIDLHGIANRAADNFMNLWIKR